MNRHRLAAFITALALAQVCLPQSPVSKNHVTVVITKAIDSTQPNSWQAAGQVKNAVSVGKVLIPAGANAVVGLVSSFESTKSRLSLLSITIDGQAIPVNSTIAAPGAASPVGGISTLFQKLAAQNRQPYDGTGRRDRGDLDSASTSRQQPPARTYIPSGEELVFILKPKQLQHLQTVP